MALRLKCTGKVQGVFYRASTKSKADELGLSGWVRNETDGSVAVHVEGNPQATKDMIAWCKSGPQFARVNEVHVQEVPDEDFREFSIHH